MNKRGRKPKEWNAACNWLGITAVGGKLIPVKYIMQSGPACMRTMHKAKLEMGLETVRIGNEWFWRYPAIPMHKQDKSATAYKSTVYKPEPSRIERITEEEINRVRAENGLGPVDLTSTSTDYEPYRIDTKEIMDSINFMLLDGKENEDIIREICLGCAQYPMPHPYSKEYIRSVVMHAIEGTPIKHDLNSNENKA